MQIFEFKGGEIREAEMPEWLDLAIVDSVEKGLESAGYLEEKRYGEEFGFGVVVYERDLDKPIPWIAAIDTTLNWHLVMLHTLPDYIGFLRYISPIATASMLSLFFERDVDILKVIEYLKAQTARY
jgi:hypothetical protein